jgi:hypothetical protein
MRYVFILPLLASITSAQTAWRYIPAKPDRVIAMEWRKVLESPYNSQLRRELPPDAASALAGINIIEGIDRLVLANGETGPLIVLEGNFDPNALKGSAASEGAVVKAYKTAELIVPAEPEEDDVVMALVSAKHILLGYEAALMRAIDRAPAARAVNPAAGFDLWISAGSAVTGWQIGDTLRVFRNGVWDAPAGKAPQQEPTRPDDPGGKIRIYGLEEGVREIPLGKSK